MVSPPSLQLQDPQTREWLKKVVFPDTTAEVATNYKLLNHLSQPRCGEESIPTLFYGAMTTTRPAAENGVLHPHSHPFRR